MLWKSLFITVAKGQKAYNNSIDKKFSDRGVRLNKLIQVLPPPPPPAAAVPYYFHYLFNPTTVPELLEVRSGNKEDGFGDCSISSLQKGCFSCDPANRDKALKDTR